MHSNPTTSQEFATLITVLDKEKELTIVEQRSKIVALEEVREEGEVGEEEEDREDMRAPTK